MFAGAAVFWPGEIWQSRAGVRTVMASSPLATFDRPVDCPPPIDTLYV